jgi:hypothetical protein
VMNVVRVSHLFAGWVWIVGRERTPKVVVKTWVGAQSRYGTTFPVTLCGIPGGTGASLHLVVVRLVLALST